mmetsp:Transcript_308/g.660  ORF Transcript_308/g.660 Transcript_308/m.660 type:complete len:1010 (-) Transcript_308:3040-6069(-)|eukprot:CAMPEP_0116104266 /NCGR_PEP_ID=MMETSP0327-20121206/14355_1 /TAXON_ID=44447 /ORGANISM="Pseudo-nitzschia delicatissima, Strain B596" /LENGTH=1009 /DNA_ID=CAMNT_0003596489 /DNA_START=46 /DNA_END=3075 /DNA_ORIENTATION=-
MNIEETISDYVEQQFQAFQLAEVDQGSELSASSRMAATIEKNVHIIVLNNAMKKIGLENTQKTSHDQCLAHSSVEIESFLLPLLVKYADASLTMGIDAGNRAVTRRVFDLISALACSLSSKNDDAMHTLIERVQTFSTVVSEKLRSQACTLLGCLGSHLVALSIRSERKTFSIDERDRLKEILSMIGEILLPRLNDKSQSVRHRAIKAAGMLLWTSKSVSTDNSSTATTEDSSYLALLEGLLWSMWHDPSVANRVEAIQAVPIDSAETLDHVIARIRDVKEKVRNAAIDALHLKVDPRREDIMTQEHFREIVRSGLTERCESTNIATMTLICTKWTKAAKFCPVELMRLMGATMYEEECEKALKVVLKMARASSSAKTNSILQELSDPEIRSLCMNIEKSMIRLKDSNVVFDEYQLFYTRVACSAAKESSDLTFAQKEDLMTKITPDIPTLCDMFNKHRDRFVESIQEQDEECIDQECFVCLQLLQLAKIAGLQEEGSRRHFSNVMIDSVASPETPDELVEECVEALRAAFEEEPGFFDAITVVLEAMTSSANSDRDENKKHARMLLVFSVVLEKASSELSTHDILHVMEKVIYSAVASPNSTIREIAIGCLGKLGLFSMQSTVISEFKPILLKIASNKEEAIQCRGQALLALSDWALLFSDIRQPYVDSDSGESLNFVSVVEELMEHTNTTLATIAAEVATKLLFSMNDSQGSLLASLLVSFLHPNNHQENDESNHGIDIKDVGSPLRLQQLLSLFFPAFCLKSEKCRYTLLNSIGKALSTGVDYSPKKKGKRRSVSFPLVKIVEYVWSVVMERAVSGDTAADGTTVGSKTGEFNPTLPASLQVARFLVDNEQGLNVTQLRQLCKFLGNREIRIDDHKQAELGKLKDLVEELSFIEDSTSLKSLRPLTKKLSSVKGYEDNNGDEDGEGEAIFDDQYTDDDTISENSMDEKYLQTVGNTPIEDEIMMNSMTRLSLENKENPPSVVKTKSRRSSAQSNISGLGALGSLNV